MSLLINQTRVNFTLWLNQFTVSLVLIMSTFQQKIRYYGNAALSASDNLLSRIPVMWLIFLNLKLHICYIDIIEESIARFGDTWCSWLTNGENFSLWVTDARWRCSLKIENVKFWRLLTKTVSNINNMQ